MPLSGIVFFFYVGKTFFTVGQKIRFLIMVFISLKAPYISDSSNLSFYPCSVRFRWTGPFIWKIHAKMKFIAFYPYSPLTWNLFGGVSRCGSPFIFLRHNDPTLKDFFQPIRKVRFWPKSLTAFLKRVSDINCFKNYNVLFFTNLTLRFFWVYIELPVVCLMYLVT